MTNQWMSVFILCSWAFNGSMSSDKPPNPSNKPGQTQSSHNSPIQQNNLFWNTSNPIFRIDNTDHIIDVIHGRRINIICPHYDRSLGLGQAEQFIIYAVNKEEYDTCRIMTASPRIVAKCDTPHTPKFFTISFRSFSPMPNAMQFFPGQDYHFISTSSKADLFLRVDGMCRSNNMRAVFKVQDLATLQAKQKAREEAARLRDEANLANSVVVGNNHRKPPPSQSDEEPKPKSFDFFLHQTKDKALQKDEEATESQFGSNFQKSPPSTNSKRDKTLFKQEASTSGSAPRPSQLVNGPVFSSLHVLVLTTTLPFIWNCQRIKFELNST
eukprot:maker-scaffold368_size193847-snap-gene-0.35 protein:Tk10000 transcript:maker-scaffold368_size193847-snap-gene-0.35-mRNA-1 annotation:"PREDICTED: uncharacterized protein LOC103576205 isoform X3"